MWHRLRQENTPIKTAYRILDGFGLCSAYSVKTKRWYLFCRPRRIDPLAPSEQDIIEHLAEETYIDAGVSRTTLNWILPRSYHDFLHSNIVNKMCNKQNYKDIQPECEQRLQEFVWDPEMVLDYYRNSPYDLALSPIELSQKTLLILLCTGKRPGDLDSYQKFANKFVFILKQHTKTSRHAVKEDRTIKIKRFRQRSKVCPYLTLEDYIESTKTYRKSNYLFMTTTTGTPTSRATLARWTKNVMSAAGINTEFFIPDHWRI